MKKIFYACLMAMLFYTSVLAQSDMPLNPFIRHIYTADPSARVVDVGGTPTLFVYPSQDMRPAYGCDMMDNYHVFSTTDMVNWTDHGRIFGAAEAREAWGLDYPVRNGGRNATFMWAPDCIQGPDDRFYYYFPHPLGYRDREGWDNWRTGIAIADSPDMKENFSIHHTTVGGLPPMGYIDPNIYKDYDGSYYFYYGCSQRVFGAKLADNMLEIAEPLTEMTSQLPHFHEGAWMFSRIIEGCNDTIYYMTYPGNSSTLQNYVRGQDQMLYATSKKSEGGSPLGPWTYQGAFLDATGCDTSHGSVVEFNGQWYVFYHNSSLSGQGNLRSICVDKMFFEEGCDGKIIRVIQTGEDRNISRKNIPAFIQAEDFKNGGQGIGFLENSEENTGGLPYRLGLSKSVDIASSAEGVYVTDLETGEWLAYDINVSEAKNFVMLVRVAAAAAGKFRIENEAGETLAEVDVPNTGGMNVWKSIIVHDIPLPAGNQTIKFVIEEGGFNFNYFMMTLEGPLPIGKTLAFGQNGIYVTLATGNQLRCNKGNIFAESQLTNKEKFLIEDAGDGLIALKCLDNNRYVRASTDVMTCANNSIGNDNKFYWCILRDGLNRRIALKSFSNGQVVQSNGNDNNKPLRTNGHNFEGWETFIWYDLTPPPCPDPTNPDCPCPNPSNPSCQETGINDATSESKVTIFPIPAQEYVTITTELNSSSDINIQITDLQGKILKTIEKTAYSGLTETNINISSLPAGLYLINVISNEYNVVKKLTVN